MRPIPTKIKLSNRISNQSSNKEEIKNRLTKDQNIIHFICDTINYVRCMNDNNENTKNISNYSKIFTNIMSEGCFIADSINGRA